VVSIILGSFELSEENDNRFLWGRSDKVPRVGQASEFSTSAK